MKIFVKIMLVMIMWLGIGFAVSMVAVFIGFAVEDIEFPFFSAAIGFFAGVAIFFGGMIFSIIRIVQKRNITAASTSDP